MTNPAADQTIGFGSYLRFRYGNFFDKNQNNFNLNAIARHSEKYFSHRTLL
jgi:hypothetical protein